MILGDICTRSCSFCNVKTGKPFPPDYQEPTRIAEVISDMKLIHCVITSVDRDDLLDGGSDIWAMTITSIKELNPKTTIESLIPDFKGDKDLIMKIIKAGPNIISHNIETVERLTKMVRMKAKYDRSLDVLKFISSYGIKTKSGIMLGLGETSEEIIKTMDDILNSGCKILTIGQYLQPTKNHLPVNRYVTPEEFENYKFIALEKGFDYVECGPLVRSSYHGEKQISNTVN
jgi:lipoic acid synthetase